jgi:hypothetical protein
MSQAFRQSTTAANWGSPARFTSNTLLGSFLMCVCCAELSGGTPVVSAPITSGIVWKPAYSKTVTQSGSGFVLAIYFSVNSAVVASTATTTCAASNYGGTFNDNGFQVVEFTGLSISTAVDNAVFASGASGIAVSAGPVISNGTDLVVVLAVDPSFNSTFVAASGYTLTNMGGVGDNVGACQYKVNAAPGSYATGYGNATYSGAWLCIAVAFGLKKFPVVFAAT